MSWHIEVVGTKEICWDFVQADKNVPIIVKNAIKAHLDVIVVESPWESDPNLYTMYVKSHGHVDGNIANVTYDVKRIVCGLRASSK